MRTPTPLAIFSGLLIAAVLLPFAAARADEGGDMLGRLAESYSRLAAYADQGQVGMVDKAGKTGERQTARTWLARPGNLRVEADDIRLTVNEGQITTVLDSLRKTQVEKSAAMPDADTLLVGSVGAALLGTPLGHPQTVLLHMLLDKSPARWLAREGTPKAEAEETWNSRKWRRLRIDRPLRPDWLLWIDPETGLLGRIDVLPADPAKNGMSVRWEAGEIATAAPAADAWKLDVPGDYVSIDRKVEAFRKDAVEKRKKPDAELVGKPLPDFPLEIVGKDGKTRQARIAEFKGKPLLIDVWATWCGPCRKSLPELTGTLATLDEKSELTTILLSIDKQPDDGKSLADFVRKGLERIGVNTATLPRTFLALDPDSAAAQTLKAEAIPMTVMVDSKGVVRKVHVGITPAATLRKEIAELK